MKLGILIFLIIGMCVGIYFLSQSNKPKSKVIPTPAGQQQTTAATPTNLPPSPPSDIVTVPQDWKTVTSQTYGFSLSHPSDVTHDTISEGERFYKLGPSQKGQTEMYDGINLLIKSGNLEGKSFAVLTQEKYTAAQREPAHSQVGPKTPITIATIQGVSFRVSGLGDWTAIYLPKGKDQYLEIINGTVEPTNREPILQKTVDIMLSSLKLNP